MTGIFTGILNISLQATVAAIVIILVKKFLASKINVRISYLLWVLVLFRLVFPVLPASPVSIFNAANINLVSKLANMNSTEPLADLNKAPSQSLKPANTDNYSKKVEENSSITASVTKLSGQPFSINPGILSCISYIWILGVIMISVYYIIVNLVFSFRLKSLQAVAPPLELVDRVKSAARIHRQIKFVESKSISSPCVFGVLHSTVLLPKGLLETTDEKALSLILTHEFAHIKRGDLLISWISSFLCAIHWFNPVLWYSLRLVKREQELCADAYTLSLSDETSFFEYGQTLITAVKNNRCRHPALIAAGITENKETLKQRIKNITVFTKKKYKLSFIGIALIAVIGAIVCTSGMNYPKTSDERMKFDENIMVGISPINANNPQNIRLQVYNYNKIAVHSCELEIYNNNPNQSDSKPIFSSKAFRIGGEKVKNFDIKGLEYNTAYIKFNFKVGFAFDKYSNQTRQFGDLKIFDKTSVIHGWSPVSDEEVDTFIKKNNLNVIGINRIYDFYTIVMFENGDLSGYYELYKDSNSKELAHRWVAGFSTGLDKSPVQRMGGTASGTYPFINFKINNPALLAIGDKIQLETERGTITTYLSGRAAHTVETRGYGNVSRILIYDKNEQLIYDGEKILLKDVNFTPDDRAYIKIIEEKDYKIINQSPVTHEVDFTAGMFPQKYVIESDSGDLDWKIPLFNYENSTVYLQSIVQSNESEDYLVASIYFVHHVDKMPGKILSGTYVNLGDKGPYSYTNKVFVKKNVFDTIHKTELKATASLMSSGPGDQVGLYLKRSMVEQTKGNFTLILEGLNQISYTPKY